jgi:hypothetical protein
MASLSPRSPELRFSAWRKITNRLVDNPLWTVRNV